MLRTIGVLEFDDVDESEREVELDPTTGLNGAVGDTGDEGGINSTSNHPAMP